MKQEKNLEQEIGPKDTFSSIKKRAQKQWDEKLKWKGRLKTTRHSVFQYVSIVPLSKLGFENVGTKEQPKVQVCQSLFSCKEVGTPTQTGAKVVTGKSYVNNGFWDTYRATWPAYCLLTPKKAGEMIDVQHLRWGLGLQCGPLPAMPI